MNREIEQYLRYMESTNASEHTIVAYKCDLQQFSVFLVKYFPDGMITLDEISRLFIRDFLRWLSDNGRSNRTLARKATAIKRFFFYCIKEGCIERDPTEHLKIPKYEKSLPRYFSREEMLTLLRIPDQTSIFGIRNQAILELMYSSGLRLNEVCTLKTLNIDFKTRIVKVMGKRQKERMIPFGKTCRKALKHYLKVRPEFNPDLEEQCFFVSKSGIPLLDSELRAILDRYLRLVAQSNGYSAHSIRHTFATHLLENGAELQAIQEMLGHENLSTTENYTHLSLEEVKKVYQQAHVRSKEKK